MNTMLELKDVDVRYGEALAVQGVSLTVQQGECVGLLGPNGAGKTTILNSICGLAKVGAGEIDFASESIANRPAHVIHRRGITQVPEGRKIFPSLSVIENIRVGAYGRKDKDGLNEEIDKYTEMFPRILKERRNNRGENLSGGEQQIVAIIRALVSKPSLLLLDEPSLGLAPLFIETVYELIREIHSQGNSILLVEQNASVALDVCSRVYILEAGKIVAEGTSDEIGKSDDLRAAYLGG